MNTTSQHSRRAVRGVSIVVVLVAALALGALWLSHNRHIAQAAETLQVRADAGPAVQVAVVRAGVPTHEISLLGEAQPYQSATLYAQVSGYLKTVKVDRGDHVRQGQVLAEIASPQIDSQYRGAMATLATAKTTLRRISGLVGQHYVSQQQVDDARAAVDTAQAAADDLHSQIVYETIRAPFDGTVTARFADPGALVQNASNSQTSALPIVTVTDTHRLRVRVYVDQQDAGQVKPGDAAAIRDPGNGSVLAQAEVSRSAGQLDPQTRTMLAEIDVDNANDAIVPGSAVNATLQLAAVPHPTVPAAALVLHGQQTLVALLGDDNRVHLTPVTLASTDGVQAQIASGVRPGQRLVLNAATLADGSLVRPEQAGTTP
ncbi:MAG: efflux RND transporter periplasmic adaptor subunit [Xanthomonadales bacterium]|nr:efflux RND transporter periplasmic adaptor subunit [Xanthomonadales bacterium]